MPELDTSVFIIPGDKVKNTQERLVVLNRIARSVIESVRGMHPQSVFVYAPKPRKAKPGEPQPIPTPKPLSGMNNTSWKNARERAANQWAKETAKPAPLGFRTVRVHDLKHTFGRRLRGLRRQVPQIPHNHLVKTSSGLTE